MRPTIRPIILCGGRGSRLWPLSRRSMPKQFACLRGERSLLQETILRLEDAGCGEPVFVTHPQYRFTVERQIEQLGIRKYAILLEPASRNTGPAICAGLNYLAAEDPDALALIAPSDHQFTNRLRFAHSIAVAALTAREGCIVAFGVKPDRPETAFGYLELPTTKLKYNSAQPFRRFIEKPPLHIATDMIKAGNVLWNSGMVLVPIKTALESFERKAPDIMSTVTSALHEAHYDLSFLRLGPSYVLAPDIAFDYAIMERSHGFVVPLSTGWADLGSWEQVWAAQKTGSDRLAISGNSHAIDCKDSLLFSADSSVELVGMGLRNIAAVATKDAVLVVDMKDGQSVSRVVDMLNAEGVEQAENFQQHERPWGDYVTVSAGPKFQVKKITVKPGGILSLQSHVHRAEHWVVVEGRAEVTIGQRKSTVAENQSVYIRPGEVHRLANHGHVPLKLIEVQTGNYLGEDDIKRFEDVYERV